MVLKRGIVALLLWLPLWAAAQNNEGLEAWVEETGDTWAAGEMSDQWRALLSQPVNLNDSTAVEGLFLLTPFQRQALHNYIVLYGQLLSHKELLFVPGFDSTTVELLRPVTVTEPYTPPRRWRFADGRHQLISAVGGPVGDAESLRAFAYYRYSLYDKLEVRLVADRDAGEAWGRGNFVGYHLMLSDVGRLERLLLGRYNLQFGQGLTLWTGLRPFNMMGTSPLRYASGLRPAATFYEEDWQQGVAARVRLFSRVRLSLFASYDGDEALAGTRLEWHTSTLRIGLTTAVSQLDSVASPRDYLYNVHDFRGRRQFNTGVDAIWQWRRLTLYGEAALGENGAPAVVGGLLLQTDSHHRLGLTGRYYHPDFHNRHAQPYSLAALQGEQGITFDAESRLPLGLTALASLDVHRSSVLRYADYSPSAGQWLRLQLSRQWGSTLSAMVRYSYRCKERNVPNIDSIPYLVENTLRQQWQGEVRALWGDWQLIGRVIFAGFDSERSNPQRGTLMSLSLRYARPRLQAVAALARFDVDGYYARIYFSESNLQYAWSMPALNGHGWRAHAVVRYSLTSRLHLSAKYTLTYTSGAATIGSGSAEGDGPCRQTWMIQLRWNF